jgi:hypothetical protein
MNLDKLKADVAAKATGNKVEFNELIVAWTGVQVTEYKEKLRDSNGKVIKDEKGKDKRSSTISGYTHTFNELGTGKIVKIVCKNKELNTQLLSVYKISGFGYDIRQSSMIFIDELKEIKNYA